MSVGLLSSLCLAFFSSSIPLAFSGTAACLGRHVLARAVADPIQIDLKSSLPSGPSPSLDAEFIVSLICFGLQHLDTPDPDRGLERLFYFATSECRAALTARRGIEELDRFVGHANSQALQPLLRCSDFDVGEPILIPGTPTRGAITTFVVTVWDKTTPFRHHSGFERQANLEDCWLAEAGTSPSDRTELVRFTLQQERRPPLQGCWMVKEILPLRLQFLDWD